ncbi:hypothetical protein [Abyssisolibacter fermentans]|uniref:hypothetical protein n=1 Tax=Abyssisolibacter fermentans TaxID=1766203 RepID=UPI0012E3B6D7|nr:hypothetical protein [Abyssisolibacter fermentans]
MKKFLAILCVMSMIFIMGVPSFALSSTTHIPTGDGSFWVEMNSIDIQSKGNRYFRRS